jgi:hypothetical protein
MKPVALAEINPDAPEISPANMLHLTTLGASQRTLSLFTPLIPDAVYRSSLEGLERGKERGQRSVALTSDGDVRELLEAQARAHTKNPSFKPKRRVISIRARESGGAMTATLESSSRRSSVSDATTVVDSPRLPAVDIPELSLEPTALDAPQADVSADEKDLPPRFEDVVSHPLHVANKASSGVGELNSQRLDASTAHDRQTTWGKTHELSKQPSSNDLAFQEFFCANGYLRLGSPGNDHSAPSPAYVR